MSLTDIDFDFKFEQSLFRIKSETDLKDTVIDHVFTSFLKTKQNIISAKRKSDKSETQSQVERINVTQIKDVDEAVKLAHFLSHFKPPVSQLHTIIIPAVDSTLYVVTSFLDSTVRPSTKPFILTHNPLHPQIL